MKIIHTVRRKIGRPLPEKPLFAIVAETRDPDIRRLAIDLINFRVLMEAYSQNPALHQNYRELLQLLDELRGAVVQHHQQRCACGGTPTSEVEMTLDART